MYVTEKYKEVYNYEEEKKNVFLTNENLKSVVCTSTLHPFTLNPLK